MIRIAITAAAFEAISRTLPLGSVGYERQRTASGGYFIWAGAVGCRQAVQLPGLGSGGPRAGLI